MEIANDAGLSDLLRSTSEERLCTGFEFAEGPIWVGAEGYLLFSDIPASQIRRWRPGSDVTEVYRDDSHYANGLTLDHQGRLLSCEVSGRRVSRADLDGPETAIVETFEGRRLNSPNDVVVHSSGAIFFTDPDYGLWPTHPSRRAHGREGKRELDFHGVYRLDADGVLTLLDDSFNQPNGLAFVPDESALYVADSGVNVVRRFEVASDLTLGEGTLFADLSKIDLPGVTDGMKVDEDGRLWTTGPGGIWVIAADSTILGRFEVAERVNNLAFGGDDYSSLFLAAQTSIYRVETHVRGIAPGSR